MHDEDLFRTIWNALEERGMVDAWGGAECTRTRAKWREGDMSAFFCEPAFSSLRASLSSGERVLLPLLLVAAVEVYQVANMRPPAPPVPPVDLQQEDMLDLGELFEKENNRGN